jgi:hypothetical protein
MVVMMDTASGYGLTFITFQIGPPVSPCVPAKSKGLAVSS